MMSQQTSSLYAEITATVSYCMNAASRKEVMDTAQERLNEKNMRLLKFKMVNKLGEVMWFQVDKVHTAEWTNVERTEFSSKFHVIGQVRLTVRSDGASMLDADDLLQTSYQLPRSVVNDLAHWAVPTHNGPALLCVQRYELEWKSAAAVSERVYSKVG
jgi:hypothetical protein